MPELYKSVVSPTHANCTVMRNEVEKCIEKARRIFGDATMTALSDVIVEFFARGRNIALATWGTHPNTGRKVGVLQFSMQHVSRKLVAMVKQIIPHEIAHIICMVNGWDMGHGKVWRQVCTMLGGNGEICNTLGYTDGRLKNLYEAQYNGKSYWLTGTQRRMAAGEGIIVQTYEGDQITLTKASLTGNIKPL